MSTKPTQTKGRAVAGSNESQLDDPFADAPEILRSGQSLSIKTDKIIDVMRRGVAELIKEAGLPADLARASENVRMKTFSYSTVVVPRRPEETLTDEEIIDNLRSKAIEIASEVISSYRRFNFSDFYGITENDLTNVLAERLASGLSGQGFPTDQVTSLAREIARDFLGKGPSPDPDALTGAIDLAVCALRVAARTNLDFARASGLVLQDGQEKLWINRETDRFSSAEDFLTEVYGDRLGADGNLTMADLGRLDPPLLNALNLEFRGHVRRQELHRLLPTLKERNDAKLLRAYGFIPEGVERKNKLTVLARGEGPRPE